MDLWTTTAGDALIAPTTAVFAVRTTTSAACPALSCTTGWTVVHLTAADLYEPTALVEAVQTLLARRERGVVDLTAATSRPTSPRSVRGPASP